MFDLITLSHRKNGDFNILTKGDNNDADDRGLYEHKRYWLNSRHIIGRVKGSAPYIGIFTILLNDYPLLKYAVIGLMAIMVLTSKDPNQG